jgi:integrase
MNDAQLKAMLKASGAGKYTVDRGLYFRISKEGNGFWMLRYSINGKRREFVFARYGRPPEGMTLAEARLESARLRSLVNQDIDPATERKRAQLVAFKTVNDVAEDWLEECRKRLENPQIPERVYRNDVAPYIGEFKIEHVKPLDILGILRKIKKSGRPSIANDALHYCKQLFNHSVKLGLINHNPAIAFDIKDAGGVEHSRVRALSLNELETVFRVLRECGDVFTRENYLAMALLVILGVRKGELIAAQWSEIDLENKRWRLSPERTKTGAGIVMPLPEATIPWLQELQVRANGSPYVFPSRRASKRRAYISDDTLNHALAKLFGLKVDAKKNPLPNYLGEAGIEHFVVHDLRRTCRSLLAANGVPSHVAERCLNHKIRGVEGIYDRYDYFEERKFALSCIADQISPLCNPVK